MPAPETNAVPTRPYWFAAKRYGWGWGLPTAWQGWTVLVIWLVLMLCGGALLAGRRWVGYALFTLLMTAMFVGVCYAKGEPPRWRWGK